MLPGFLYTGEKRGTIPAFSSHAGGMEWFFTGKLCLAFPRRDYKDVAVDFLAHSDAWGGEEEALWLLVEQGYQNEEIYPDTGQVIQEAKFQRALLKNVED